MWDSFTAFIFRWRLEPLFFAGAPEMRRTSPWSKIALQRLLSAAQNSGLEIDKIEISPLGNVTVRTVRPSEARSAPETTAKSEAA